MNLVQPAGHSIAARNSAKNAASANSTSTRRAVFISQRSVSDDAEARPGSLGCFAEAAGPLSSRTQGTQREVVSVGA